MKKLSSKIYIFLIILAIGISLYHTYKYIIKFYIEQYIKHELYINTNEKFTVDVNKINIDFRSSKINISYICITNKNLKNYQEIKLDNIDIKYHFGFFSKEMIFSEIKLSKIKLINNFNINNTQAILNNNIIEKADKLLNKIFDKINIQNIIIDNIECNSINYPIKINFSFNNENKEYIQFVLFIKENLTNNYINISSTFVGNDNIIQGDIHCFNFIKILNSNYLNDIIKNLYYTKYKINNLIFDGKFNVIIKNNKIKKINTYSLQVIIDSVNDNDNLFEISSLINIKYINNSIIISALNKDYNNILNYNLITKDISLKLQIKKIDTNTLYNLWSNKIAPDSREWYKKNILSGMFKNINIVFKNAKDFTINSEFNDINSNYYNNLPPFLHSNGKININSENLLLYFSKSEIMKNKLNDLSLKYNFEKDNIDIFAKSKGNILSFISYIKKLPIAQKNIEQLKFFTDGMLENNINLSFLISNNEFKLNKFIIDGRINNGIIDHNLLSNNINNIDGNYSVTIDNKNKVTFDSSFILEKKYSVKINNKNDIYHYKITSNVNYLMGLFGYQETCKQDGTVEVDITQSSESNFYINNKFINAKFYIPYIDHEINIDNKSISFEINIENNQIIFNKILYNNKDELISGNIVYDIENNLLKTAILSAKIDCNDFSIKYKNYNNIKNINIKGKQIDLSKTDSPHNDDKTYDNIIKAIENISEYKITIDLNKIIYNKISVFDFKANIDIDQPKNTFFSGSFDKKEYIHLYSLDGILYFQTNNAGKFLKMLGVLDSINEGSLLIKISTENKRNKIGLVQINDFFVKDMHILTKILSLTSFVGIIDVLQGDGIYFSNFKAPFTYSDGIFFIKNALAEGMALGINFDSIYSLHNHELIMNGSLTPLYILNKLIWRVPIIGKILTDDQNHSLMAVNYSIHRKNDHNNINIDPLSLLVPQGVKKILRFFS